MKITHVYEAMNPEKRPQDHSMDLAGWTFTSGEHGGEFPDCMPQVIFATDAEGRKCCYFPAMAYGKVIDHRYFHTSHETPESSELSTQP